MKKTIHKYVFEAIGDVELRLPIGAKILSVQTQENHICLWAIIDLEHDIETRIFRIVGTGWTFREELMERMKYIATVQGAGFYVWHVFEVYSDATI